MEEYFNKELVEIIDTNGDQEEFFSKIFQRLKEKQYVENSFFEALTVREKEYPTGLKTEYFGVSIPHTDPTHIKKPFIYMVKLKNPITFGQMGTLDQQVDVNYSFVIGFQEGEHQLVLLQNLMKMFSDGKIMGKLSKSDTEKEIYDIVMDYYK